MQHTTAYQKKQLNYRRTNELSQTARWCFGQAHIYGNSVECSQCKVAGACGVHVEGNQAESLRQRENNRLRYADCLSKKGYPWSECFEEARRVYP